MKLKCDLKLMRLTIRIVYSHSLPQGYRAIIIFIYLEIWNLRTKNDLEHVLLFIITLHAI